MSTARPRRSSSSAHQLGRRQHGVEQPGQLVGRLALGPQGDDEPDQLGGRGLAGEDRAPSPPAPGRRTGRARRAARSAGPATPRGWPAASSSAASVTASDTTAASGRAPEPVSTPGGRGQALRRRWRMMRRRSRSVAPPHTPAFSREASACSRHAALTRTPVAHRLRDGCVVVVVGVEDARVEAPAGPQLPPFDVTERHVRNPPSKSVVRPPTIERADGRRQRQIAPARRSPRRTIGAVGTARTLVAVPADEPPTPRSTGPRCSTAWPPSTFDVLVVGGGITGVGVALDAASRGLRTALVERDDFAAGTSSKSSKLVHGGLRYLQQGEVRLVYEALHERQRLRRNAPHLVKLLPFMIPILTKDGRHPPPGRPGAGLGDVDVRPHRRVAHRQAAQAARRPTPRSPTCRRCPASGCRGGYLYYDATTDDARLVPDHRPHRRRTRRRRRQPLPASSALTKDADGQVDGATVEADGRRFDSRGPGRRQRRRRVGRRGAGAGGRGRPRLASARPRASTSPCRGRRCATTSPSSSRCRGDKRSLFVVPWGPDADGTFEHTYVGTTDTDYDGPARRPAVHRRRHRLRARAR